jgi:hypothetical protein
MVVRDRGGWASRTLRALLVVGIGLLPLAVAGVSGAQGKPEESQAELAKKTQNPVADLISVPLQSDFNFGVGPKDDLQYVLNIQPVVPFHLTESWNLITRTILPLIYQPELAPGVGDVFGLGDIQLSLFLSPAKPGHLIWGVGPIFSFPSATDDVLGSGKFSIGPSVVGLTIQGHWVIGALVNNLFSVAGDSDRKTVNQMLIQPFLNYNLPDGWYVTSAPIITADWEANSDDRWTVPVGGGVGKILRLGKLPLNAQLQAFYNVVRPDSTAEWQLRVQLQFLFPK